MHPSIWTMGIKHEWIDQDAWYRKDLDNGTYLICSRKVSGGWTWRHTTWAGHELNGGAATTSQGARYEADYSLGLFRIPVKEIQYATA